jgi:hypothetical protein
MTAEAGVSPGGEAAVPIVNEARCARRPGQTPASTGNLILLGSFHERSRRLPPRDGAEQCIQSSLVVGESLTQAEFDGTRQLFS